MLEVDDITLARAKRGERRAQGQLIAVYQDRVYALVARMLVGRQGWVDDVAQDVFVKVIRGLPRFDPRGRAKVSTWILTIATRTAIDVLRRPSGVDEAVPDEASDAASPEAAAADRQDVARVTAAMLALDPDYRAVLVLRAFHDLDYPEIAEALGVAVGTVKSRLSRARAALRSAMEAS